MDEVRIVRRRTHIWPLVIAVIVLALVIAYVFFVNRPAQESGVRIQGSGLGRQSGVLLELPDVGQRSRDVRRQSPDEHREWRDGRRTSRDRL
jgi:hypothetical protein